jgi:sodium/hydrogen antiporter
VIPSLVVLAAVATGWALAAGRLERWHVRAPLVMVLAGLTTGFLTDNVIANSLNSGVAQHVAEIILAILLFIDATAVPAGRLWGQDPRAAARALLLAMPLSLLLTVLLGLVLLPPLAWATLLVLACVIVPIDFAPAESLVHDRRIPARVRGVLNIEAGYNDGIISPVFLFALALAGTSSAADTALDALLMAIPFSVKAILTGLVLGALIAGLMNRAERYAWMTGRSGRIAVVVAPLLTYTVTVAIEGNGFVAAFVCGIAFRFVRQLGARRRRGAAPPHADFELIEDTTAMLAIGMWFFFGITTIFALSTGVDWRVVVFALAALTVLRVVPILLAFLGSPFTWPERLMLGAFGPRGTTSIVFGLLAFNVLPDGTIENTVLLAMSLTVLGSVLLHGVGSSVALRTASADEPVH